MPGGLRGGTGHVRERGRECTWRDEPQLDAALHQQRRFGNRLGVALVKLGFLPLFLRREGNETVLHLATADACDRAALVARVRALDLPDE